MLTDAGNARAVQPQRSRPAAARTYLTAEQHAHATLVRRLRAVPLFASVSEAALQRVVALATEIDVPRGMLLIERAQPASGVFVILDGTVTVELHDGAVELGPSEVVGELGVLAEGATRSARVRAATPVRCLALSRPDFTRLLETEPSFGAAVASVLARRLLERGDAGRTASPASDAW